MDTDGTLQGMAAAAPSERLFPKAENCEFLKALIRDTPADSIFIEVNVIVADSEGFISDIFDEDGVPLKLRCEFTKITEEKIFMKSPYVVDEICRLLLKGRSAVINLYYNATDPLSGESAIFKKNWVIVEPLLMVGTSSEDLIGVWSRIYKNSETEMKLNTYYESAPNIYFGETPEV